jgi:hypothetical protein
VSTTPAANLPPVLLVSLIPVANLTLVSKLPLLSMTRRWLICLVASNGNNIRLLTPLNEPEEKKLSYSTTQRRKDKNIFVIEDIFHLPPGANEIGGAP